MKTSTAEANGWRCPECGNPTTRDESGKGFVRHTTNRACLFQKGQRDSTSASSPPDWTYPSVSRSGEPAGLKQGRETGVFGQWLTEYLSKSTAHRGCQVFYDHGDRGEANNVVAIKGFYGAKVSNLNRLADVDVMVISPDQSVRLLIEIEERHCSPKKILGDIMAISMCNRFAIRQHGIQRYFEVNPSTTLVIAGVLPPQGNRQEKVNAAILPRVRQLQGVENGVNPANVSVVFQSSIACAIAELQTLIRELFPD
jgi:hypothetical protein